ncbi:MAG TPA: DnaB-like helicase C-terminal domain-containing protein [Candidatus Limnocylindrales bacterium]|nr:DnaB-like helicase C-terminal domain-containing protein [Candidatus Limnocylindrales bacterium]
MSATILEAENTLLGRLMLDNSLLQTAELAATDFLSAQHRQVYEAICTITADGEVAEPVTVADFLERATGRKWLQVTTGMVADNFRGSGIDSYARAIKTAARTRQALQIAAELQEAANNDVAGAVDYAIRQLMAINATSQDWHCHVKSAVGAAIDLIDQAHQADGKPTGISTGIRDLDDSLGGMHGGDLIVVAARPAMGKTAWALNTMLGSGVATGMVSGEQGRAQIGMRLMAINGSISLHNMRRGKLEDAEWARINAAANALSARPVWLFDRPGPSIQDIQRQARRWKYENNIRLLLVDYIQKITGGEGRDMRLQVGDVVTQLKNIARELDIVVVALAQVSRDVEKRPMGQDGMGRVPYMGDIAESGHIEREADQIYTLYRPFEYEAEERFRGIAFANVCKNRHGPTGIIKLAWRGEYLQFGDLAHTERQWMAA